MSKFNSKAVPKNRTINLAGGSAYSIDAEHELTSIVLTSFCDNQYYRSNDNTIKRIKELMPQCKAKYIAKLALYARNEIGMRSITHVIASLLAPRLSSKKWAKDFYQRIVARPDDMYEIIAYHKSNDNKLSAAMKKGFAIKLSELNEYSLSKYKMENKDWKMVDIVNLLHPKSTPALDKLMHGTLQPPNTWEVEYSRIGQMEIGDGEKRKLRIAFWIENLNNNKIGYMALLRNLRNIALLKDKVLLDLALERLCNKSHIRNSKVLPFRFSTAYTEIIKGNDIPNASLIASAISKATNLACENISKLDDTAVIVDISGSMSGNPAEIASLFAAMLTHNNPTVDIVKFSTDAKYHNYNAHDSIITIAQNLKFAGGGTNFQSAIKCLNRPYKRIILLSDMQSWAHQGVNKAYNDYCRKFGCEPYFYSFDLVGYGTSLLPQSKVIEIFGFSEKILELIPVLETDKIGLTNIIHMSSDL